MVVCGIFAIAIPLMERAPSFKRLLNKAATSDGKARALRGVLDSVLQSTLDGIDLHSNQHRASLYFYHDQGFHMLARYSSNPVLALPGRGVYRIDQGFIGQAWLEEFVIGTLPANPDRWVRSLVSNYGFTESEAKSISMQSRKMGGFTIRYQGRSVGVVMLEALDPDGLPESALRRAKEIVDDSPLSDLVGRSAAFFPAIEAYEDGLAARANMAILNPTWRQVRRTT